MRLVLPAVILALFCPAASAQTFTDASNRFLSVPAGVSAVTVADLNGDGRTDVYTPGMLFHQQTDGTYRNVMESSKITVEGLGPLIMLPNDVSGNGLMDIVILNQAPGSRYFDNVNGYWYRLANGERNLSVQTLSIGGVWGDFDVDGRTDLFMGSADGQNQLYLRSLDHTFINVSQTKQTQSAPGCSMAVADFDRDLDLDVFIGSCGGMNSMLVYDTVRDRFNNFASNLRLQGFRTSRAAVWLDYDNDGWMDLFVLNQRQDIENGDNYLYRNQGGTAFEDRAAAAGVDGVLVDSRTRQRAAAADFDNDGWTDLFVTATDAPDRLFLNQGDGTFLDTGNSLLPYEPESTVFTAADVNNDGWIDILYGDPAGHHLFLNSGTNNWTKIGLRRQGGNPLGLGARVEVTTAAGTQTKQMVPGGGGLSQGVEPVIHFGLGQAEIIDQVVVTWQDGTRDVLTNVPVNQELTIAFGGFLNNPPAPFDLVSPPDAAFYDTTTSSITFNWAEAVDTDNLSYTLTIDGPGTRFTAPDLAGTQFLLDTEFLGRDQVYTWTVHAYDGFSGRPAIRTRSFTFGDPARAVGTLAEPALYPGNLPAMSAGSGEFIDVDGDLDLDLFVVGHVGSQPAGGVFRAVDQGVATTNAGEFIFKGLANSGMGVDGVLDARMSAGDLDGDGDVDVIVSGRRQDGTTRLTVYVNVDGSLNSGALAINARWGGPIQLRDVDGDGDGDVLISGSTRGTPPYEPTTLLYRNEGSAFTEWAEFPGAMFGAAEFVDADGDGDLDLALSGDTGHGLGHTAVYRNDGDTFARIDLPVPGLLYASADWGDFDQDGRPDLLLSGGTLSPDLMEGTTTLLRQVAPFQFEVVFSPLTRILAGRAVFGDYEGDGDLDILVSGSSTPLGERIGRVFRNQEGRYVAELDFQGALNGDLIIGDYNVDGDLDFLVLGIGPDGNPSVQFFINQQVAEPVPVRQ